YLAARFPAIRRDLDSARSLSGEWRHRYEQERETNEVLRKQAQPTQQPASPALGAVFFLDAARSVGRSAEPPVRIVLPAEPQWVVLAVDRELDPEFRSARATLVQAGGSRIWEAVGIRTTPGQTLSLVIPSSLLHSGDYILIIEGLTRDGRYLEAARYTLRV